MKLNFIVNLVDLGRGDQSTKRNSMTLIQDHEDDLNGKSYWWRKPEYQVKSKVMKL